MLEESRLWTIFFSHPLTCLQLPENIAINYWNNERTSIIWAKIINFKLNHWILIWYQVKPFPAICGSTDDIFLLSWITSNSQCLWIQNIFHLYKQEMNTSKEHTNLLCSPCLPSMTDWIFFFYHVLGWLFFLKYWN